MIQTILVAIIVAAAVVFAVWRIARAAKGKGGCGCDKCHCHDCKFSH